MEWSEPSGRRLVGGGDLVGSAASEADWRWTPGCISATAVSLLCDTDTGILGSSWPTPLSSLYMAVCTIVTDAMLPPAVVLHRALSQHLPRHGSDRDRRSWLLLTERWWSVFSILCDGRWSVGHCYALLTHCTGESSTIAEMCNLI